MAEDLSDVADMLDDPDYGDRPTNLTDPMANFQILDNIHVRAYWKSMNTNEDALLEPDWYQHNGTPQDSEGEDMEYIETRLYNEE